MFLIGLGKGREKGKLSYVIKCLANVRMETPREQLFPHRPVCKLVVHRTTVGGKTSRGSAGCWLTPSQEETVREQKMGNRSLPFRDLEREIPSHLFIASNVVARTIPMSRKSAEITFS